MSERREHVRFWLLSVLRLLWAIKGEGQSGPVKPGIICFNGVLAREIWGAPGKKLADIVRAFDRYKYTGTYAWKQDKWM